MITKHTAYPYMGPFLMNAVFYQWQGKITDVVQYKLSVIYVALNHINMIPKLEILVQNICLMISTYELPVIYFYIVIKSWSKVYNRIRTGILILIHIVCVREVFMTASFLHNRLRLFIIGDALGKGS